MYKTRNREFIYSKIYIHFSGGVLMCLDNTYHLALRHFCNFCETYDLNLGNVFMRQRSLNICEVKNMAFITYQNGNNNKWLFYVG